MLILFDNNVPRGLARALSGHIVEEARGRGWATLKNGDLLNAAQQAGFDVFLTADKNIRYQQNLQDRVIAIVVLSRLRWSSVRAALPEIQRTVAACGRGTFIEVEIPLQ